MENGALRAERVSGMTKSDRHLAQFNIARIRYPLDDPRMTEFVENVERVHRLGRLQDESGHAMNIRVYDDPTILPNLTVWENVEALERFVWQTLHRRFYARREEWFEPIKTTLVFWWIPVGHRPEMSEGVARLDHLIANGPSDYVFSWKEIAGAKLWKTARGDERSEHAA